MSKAWASAALIAGLGLTVGLTNPTLRGQQASTAPAIQPVIPTSQERPADRHPTLNATLYMQGAAEYAAVCTQTYSTARQAVFSALELGAAAGDPGKPPAVIMDLDETVLDNSKFQALVINGILAPGREPFLRWAARHPGGAGLVPGAKAFIDAVRARGVRVVFVTNRDPAAREGTIETLRLLGIPTEGRAEPSDLGLLVAEDSTSDKRPRFRRVESACRVLAYIGDNLGDFPAEFHVPPGMPASARRERVAELAAEFGTRWFILPNPVYGDWLGGLGPHPALNLVVPGQ
jgi:5'-nucleotidase (lipoprotein e(P4) family)